MYLSIDIETTGLDPSCDQILQLAAVCPLGGYNVFVSHGRYSGNAFALSLNSWILEILSKGKDYRIVPADYLYDHFVGWLKEVKLDCHRIFALGKNFGAFDRQFLNALDPRFDKLFHYRSLDVGSLYADPLGIMSLKEIIEADPERYMHLDPHHAEHDATIAYLAAAVKMNLKPPVMDWYPIEPVPMDNA